MSSVNVTRVFFPPIEEYEAQIKRIWENKWLTNRGQLVKELEGKLIEYLGVNNLTLTTNGTLPMQIAIKAMGLSGEIITTPFSYVATTSSIVWEGCKPVFVDIHPEYLTIDEEKIEAAITSGTTAILATHVFGNPCNVERIDEIARKHNLKVIYDAAHCFGVKYKEQSVFNYGDLSTCSFHATKLFHTGEGGCWVTNNDDLQHELFYRHNFGHNGPEAFFGLGINAKMSELQAAMGLSVFPYINEIINSRKVVVELYKSLLYNSNIKHLKIREGTEWNYHYFPIIFPTECLLLEVMNKLIEHGFIPRRYFYPSLNLMEYVISTPCAISEEISNRILCLPLSSEISQNEVERICEVVNSVIRRN